MDARIPLSPKKLRSANVLPTYCPSSPIKRTRSPIAKQAVRSSQTTPNTLRDLRTPVIRGQTSSAILSSPCQIITSSRGGSPIKPQLAPFKVLSDDTVYATHVDAQLANNSDLILSPPKDVTRISPSPRKRDSPMTGRLRERRGNRPVFGLLSEETRVPRLNTKDPLTLSQNSFLTPPRPRLQNSRAAILAEERISKSASPRLGRALGSQQSLDHANQGFTIFFDQSEYVSRVNTAFEVGEGVNKENHWVKNQLHV